MGSTEGWEAWWTDGQGVTGLAGSASWGARSWGKESRGWGSPWTSYISVILHGLLQNCAGQLRLCPVPQPDIQGLQVGLHAGAPWEILQSGERGEKTQIPSWKQQGSIPASPAQALGSTSILSAGEQCGPGKVVVPISKRLGAAACSLAPGGKSTVCMFRLQTPAPTEGGKKPLCP